METQNGTRTSEANMNTTVTQEQIDFYRENGFIVLHDFLTPEELETWREAVDGAAGRGRRTPRVARIGSAWRVAARPAPTMPTAVIAEWSHRRREREGCPPSCENSEPLVSRRARSRPAR